MILLLFSAGVGPTASAFTLTGPGSGTVGVSAGPFSVAPNNPLGQSETVTITGGGTPIPDTLTFAGGSSAAQTFTFTASVPGTVLLTASPSPALGNPPTLPFTAYAPTVITPATVLPVIVDDDLMQAIRAFWSAAVITSPVAAVDDDTLQAIRAFWSKS